MAVADRLAGKASGKTWALMGAVAIRVRVKLNRDGFNKYTFLH